MSYEKNLSLTKELHIHSYNENKYILTQKHTYNTKLFGIYRQKKEKIFDLLYKFDIWGIMFQCNKCYGQKIRYLS